MTTRYRLQRIKTCANCSHHVSAHSYVPNSGQRPCVVPGCRCNVFRSPKPGERVRSSK